MLNLFDSVVPSSLESVSTYTLLDVSFDTSRCHFKCLAQYPLIPLLFSAVMPLHGLCIYTNLSFAFNQQRSKDVVLESQQDFIRTAKEINTLFWYYRPVSTDFELNASPMVRGLHQDPVGSRFEVKEAADITPSYFDCFTDAGSVKPVLFATSPMNFLKNSLRLELTKTLMTKLMSAVTSRHY